MHGVNNMISRLDVEYEFEDNDASSSAFGWEFQINAGIYLFLHYINEVQLVAVESKFQDIEMVLSDKTLYAQAKALQDEQTINTENTKLRDAIVSLAKVNTNDGDILLYISNLRTPIDGEKDKFRNDIVAFSQCHPDLQSYIRKQVETVIDKIKRKLTQKGLSDAKKKKNEVLLERLINFDYEHFYIASIYPFAQTDNRYKIIEEKIVKVLTNKMGFESLYATGLVKRVLNHWQQTLRFNASIVDKKNVRKFIDKKDFVWTVIAIDGESVNANFIEATLSHPIDSRLQDDCKRYLEREENLYHERFDFMNRVMQGYVAF